MNTIPNEKDLTPLKTVEDHLERETKVSLDSLYTNLKENNTNLVNILKELSYNHNLEEELKALVDSLNTAYEKNNNIDNEQNSLIKYLEELKELTSQVKESSKNNTYSSKQSKDSINLDNTAIFSKEDLAKFQFAMEQDAISNEYLIKVLSSLKESVDNSSLTSEEKASYNAYIADLSNKNSLTQDEEILKLLNILKAKGSEEGVNLHPKIEEVIREKDSLNKSNAEKIKDNRQQELAEENQEKLTEVVTQLKDVKVNTRIKETVLTSARNTNELGQAAVSKIFDTLGKSSKHLSWLREDNPESVIGSLYKYMTGDKTEEGVSPIEEEQEDLSEKVNLTLGNNSIENEELLKIDNKDIITQLQENSEASKEDSNEVKSAIDSLKTVISRMDRGPSDKEKYENQRLLNRKEDSEELEESENKEDAKVQKEREIKRQNSSGKALSNDLRKSDSEDEGGDNGRDSKWGAKALLAGTIVGAGVLAAGASLYYSGSSVKNSYDQYKMADNDFDRDEAVAKVGGGTAGAIAGGIAGAKVGGSVGLWMGSLALPLVGSAIGATGGAIVGGLVGAGLGYKMGSSVTDYIHSTMAGPLDSIPDEQKNNPFITHEYLTKVYIPKMIEAMNAEGDPDKKQKIADEVADLSNIADDLLKPDNLESWMNDEVKTAGLDDEDNTTQRKYLTDLMSYQSGNELYYNAGMGVVNNPAGDFADRDVNYDDIIGTLWNNSPVGAVRNFFKDDVEADIKLQQAADVNYFNSNNKLGKEGQNLKLYADDNDKNFDALTSANIISDDWGSNSLKEGAIVKLSQMPKHIVEGVLKDGNLNDKSKDKVKELLANMDGMESQSPTFINKDEQAPGSYIESTSSDTGVVPSVTYKGVQERSDFNSGGNGGNFQGNMEFGKNISKVEYKMKGDTGKSSNPNDYKLEDLFTATSSKIQDLKKINPDMLNNLKAMGAEYLDKFGSKMQINSAFRSFKRQAELKRQFPKTTAQPGSSMHNYGMAVDMESAHANRAVGAGLFKKYGFHRPVKGEAWHVEPSGIDRAKIRANGMKAYYNNPTGEPLSPSNINIKKVESETEGLPIEDKSPIKVASELSAPIIKTSTEEKGYDKMIQEEKALLEGNDPDKVSKIASLNNNTDFVSYKEQKTVKEDVPDNLDNKAKVDSLVKQGLKNERQVAMMTGVPLKEVEKYMKGSSDKSYEGTSINLNKNIPKENVKDTKESKNTTTVINAGGGGNSNSGNNSGFSYNDLGTSLMAHF